MAISTRRMQRAKITTSSGLALPRIPWEGGPSFYNTFPHAARRGWNSDSFIPIGLWWGGVTTQAQLDWDKSKGINTYVITDSSNAQIGPLMEANGMSWIGSALPGLNRNTSLCWVGDFLDDEVEGRFTPEDGRAHMQSLCDQLPDHNKIRYANWSSMLVNTWFNTNDAALYTGYTDATSLDQYWYSVSFCSWDPYMGDYYYNQAVPQATCRTSRSYGRSVDMLRNVFYRPNARLQPAWNFIEVVTGAPAEDANPRIISVGELKGAAMSSIIHEARGLMWFPQCFNGPYGSGNAVQSAFSTPGYPGLAQVNAMGEVNNFIQSLAPVINSQSYVWNFGANTDTMLKVYGGFAYIFAMTEGTSGSRTFTLPSGISGTSVEVVGESRNVAVNGSRQFADTFATEYSYHVYKIAL